MKVFLSWSGERSLQLAEALRDWLPLVLQTLQPWLSSRDLDRGALWASNMTNELSETGVGIFCLTRENLGSNWIHFEAGAISKSLDNSFVCTLLLGLEPSDLTLPLSLFQSTRVTRTDIGKLVATLHRASGVRDAIPSLSKSQIDEIVGVWWPKLEQKLLAIPKDMSVNSGPVRPDREILTEILDTVRGFRKETAESAATRVARGRLAELQVSRQQDLAKLDMMREELDSCREELAAAQIELAAAEASGAPDVPMRREQFQLILGRRSSLESKIKSASARELDADMRIRELRKLLENNPSET